MRRGIWLLVLGVVAAALGVGSARADGSGTTTTATTTTGTTTTGATTTPTYAPLPSAYLPTTCVGAGDAAIAPPGGRALVLGTPASGAGPSAYPTSSPVVAFASSATSGSTCTGTHFALTSVSLFGGFVTASSVAAMNGRGTVSGLTIDGSPVSLSAGESALLGYWGQLTLGKTVGRLRAPVVVLLLRRYWNLPAGTTILVGFAASALLVHTATTQRSSETPQRTSTTPTAESQNHSQPKRAATKKKHPKRHVPQSLRVTPPPDFPASPDPLLVGGGLAPAAQDNAVVSIAMRYLDVPYKWAGASPKTGFDCSGLVQYVFAQLGVSLPHYAAAQWYSPYAVSVPPNRLRPGDLVFFIGSDGTLKAPGHVAIYVGDGYLIDAPHTGALVQIDNLDERWFADKYVGAKRIVAATPDARHLLHGTKPGKSAPAIAPGFPPPITISPLGGSLGVAAAGTAAVRTASHGSWMWTAAAGTAAIRTASRGFWMWDSVILGGLLLLLFTGGLVVRRGQPPDASPATDSSN